MIVSDEIRIANMPKGLSITSLHPKVEFTLYDTLIVSVTPKTRYVKSSIFLSAGEFETPHTKNCINLILNYYGWGVKSVQGVWYIHHLTDTSRPNVLFINEMVFCYEESKPRKVAIS